MSIIADYDRNEVDEKNVVGLNIVRIILKPVGSYVITKPIPNIMNKVTTI